MATPALTNTPETTNGPCAGSSTPLVQRNTLRLVSVNTAPRRRPLVRQPTSAQPHHPLPTARPLPSVGAELRAVLWCMLFGLLAVVATAVLVALPSLGLLGG